MRVWGEDAAGLAALLPAEPLAAARELEDRLAGDLPLPAGPRIDAHVHLGRDADGHELRPAELVADLDRWEIDRAVCFPANEPGPDGQFRAANAAVAAAAQGAPARIVPFCRLDPRGDWAAELDRAARAGARGLKLHPVAQSFPPEGDESLAVIAAATDLGWPVLIHAGFGARPLAGPLADVRRALPRARLILAHAGRGDARGLADRFAADERVLFDTSLAALVDVVDLAPERLCFGSDRPYGEHATALALIAAARALCGWSDRQTGGVLAGNLGRWLA